MLAEVRLYLADVNLFLLFENNFEAWTKDILQKKVWMHFLFVHMLI